MNKILRKFLSCVGLLTLTLSTSSCFLDNFFLVLEPLEFKVIAQKGSASLSLAAYYEDPLMSFSDDIEVIENAFSVNDSSSYQFIVYDAVRGLDLCEEYGNFAYVGTIALGNQQLVPLNKESETGVVRTKTILANNEHGSLGKTIKKIVKDNPNLSVEFTTKNDLELYNYLYTSENLGHTYDYCLISEPYATRLMTLKDSPLFDEDYEYYTRNTDRDFDTTKSQYCLSLRYLYQTYNTNDSLDFGIPQTGIFINKEAYQTNPDSFKTVLKMLNAEIALKYVMDANNTRTDFRKLSEGYHDENLDDTSEQTKIAYKVQFDKVGISWNEVPRLQAWHPVLGQDGPFDKFVNRLEYVKDIVKYYSSDYMNEYYNYIQEDVPSSENFINIKL